MDLNQVPNDQMLNGVKFGEIELGNYYGVVDLDSKIVSFDVEEKNLELKVVDDKIRVLGGEKLGIEDEIKGLKDKDKYKNSDFRGSKIEGEMMCGEGDEVSRVDEVTVENKVLECENLRDEGEHKVLENENKDKNLGFRGSEIEVDEVSRVDDLMVENKVLECENLRVEDGIKGLKNESKDKDRGSKIGDEFCWEGEGEELSKIDELMMENKVLECERNAAIKEVEVWKKKCKELELLVIELEKRLKCQGKCGISAGIMGASLMNDEDVAGSKDFGSTYQVPRVDGVMPLQGTCTPDKLDVLPEGTLLNKVHAKKRLAFQSGKSCDVKIAPSSPTSAGVGGGGSKPSAALIDIIDSDNECDVHAEHRTDSLCLDNSCKISEYGAHEADEIMDEEENTGRRTVPCNTRATKTRRDLKMVMSDDESEDNKYKPRRRVLKVENSDNEGEYDDDNNHDTTPVRQLLDKVNTASESDDDEDNIPISQLKRKRYEGSSRPRRLLVKHGKGEHEDGTHVMGSHTDTSMASEDVANEMSSDVESESSDSFIVSDSDVEDVEDDVSKDPEDDVLEDLEDNSGELEETSDSDMDFGEVISKLGSRRDPNSEWIGEGDMLADFGKSPELCMKAVCALYRQQTNEELEVMASLIHNGRGFSKYDATRGTYLGDFLTNGDRNGDMVKSVEELQRFDSKGLEDCHKFAKHYSKQLFKIYENGEDPFFP